MKWNFLLLKMETVLWWTLIVHFGMKFLYQKLNEEKTILFFGTRLTWLKCCSKWNVPWRNRLRELDTWSIETLLYIYPDHPYLFPVGPSACSDISCPRAPRPGSFTPAPPLSSEKNVYVPLLLLLLLLLLLPDGSLSFHSSLTQYSLRIPCVRAERRGASKITYTCVKVAAHLKHNVRDVRSQFNLWKSGLRAPKQSIMTSKKTIWWF